ncbi:MAG: hypothetical protein LUQ09_05320 [Methanomassiliicoccales archaeon]|nr:hypothetical protein [Methanomassiliicoccales archaeon]
MPTQIGIGIDVGGTFTDGVIYDLEKHCVLATSKVSTDSSDLTGSILRCDDICRGGVPEADIHCTIWSSC